jgi:NAD(P)-dependent dehydrogenase (short-subunit alcohol dehydrogenase family)
MTEDLLGLEGHNALVTGAGRGAGRGIALTLARAGVSVAILDLDFARAEAVAREALALGVRSTALSEDVSTKAGADAAIAASVEALGDLHIGVNNVGNFGTHVPTPAVEMEWDFWQSAIDRNLKTTFFCARAMARSMQARGVAGSIVNIASLAGLRGSPNLAPYGAVKAAIMQLTQTLALELAPSGIRVNCVGPTAIEGPSLQESLAPASIEAMAKSIPLGRVGNADDIAGAVTLLASNLARFVTGQTLMCDGGVSCTTLRPSLAPGEARPRH